MISVAAPSYRILADVSSDAFEVAPPAHDGAEGLGWRFETTRGGELRFIPTAVGSMGSPNDAVHVIRHHDERVQRHVVANPFGAVPFLGDDTAVCIQRRLPLNDIAE